MNENNTYKYLSVVLAIIAIIFAILYFTRPTQPVSDTINEVSQRVTACRENMAAWQQANIGSATTTQEDRDNLESILNDCIDAMESSVEEL